MTDIHRHKQTVGGRVEYIGINVGQLGPGLTKGKIAKLTNQFIYIFSFFIYIEMMLFHLNK